MEKPGASYTAVTKLKDVLNHLGTDNTSLALSAFQMVDPGQLCSGSSSDMLPTEQESQPEHSKCAANCKILGGNL